MWGVTQTDGQQDNPINILTFSKNIESILYIERRKGRKEG
jgi:hypothetical protein